MTDKQPEPVVYVAGIPTKIVEQVSLKGLLTSDQDLFTRKIEITMPRVFWLEREEVK